MPGCEKGYRGKAPVLSPHGAACFRYIGLYPVGAGDSPRPDRPSPGLPLKATRGRALQALPLFSLLLPTHTGEGNAPPAPPPLTRWGGGSWLLLLHPVGAAPVPRAAAAKARAALPDRSSKPQTATPSGRYSRNRSAARARTAAAMHSAAAPASAPGVATTSSF